MRELIMNIIYGKIFLGVSAVLFAANALIAENEYREIKLETSDNVPFGYSVAISGKSVAVGAGGRIHLYSDIGGESQKEIKIFPKDPRCYNFGASIAIGENILVAGAPNFESNREQGAAYVFTDIYGANIKEKVLTASDGMSHSRTSYNGDWFGAAVCVSAKTVVVGAPHNDLNEGEAYVYFDIDSADCKETQVLPPQNRKDCFAASVAYSDDILAVGAEGFPAFGGCVYVRKNFSKGGGDFIRLKPSDEFKEGSFGFSVAVTADAVFVGAPYHPDGKMRTGAVYIFTDVGTANQKSEILMPIGGKPEKFGISIAASDSTLVIGAPLSNGGRGAVYVYTDVCGPNRKLVKISPSDAVRGTHFGHSVAISGSIIAVSAPGQNKIRGAAYVYFPLTK